MEKATKLTPYEKRLMEALEALDYKVDVYDEPVSRYNKTPRRYAELEKYTNGGVDQIITLEPFTIDSFEEYYEGYDVDEEIELHRQDGRYRNAFSIRQSLEDFEAWEQTVSDDLDALREQEDYIIGDEDDDDEEAEEEIPVEVECQYYRK